MRWLAPRHLDRHYHVRLGDAAHVERLARRLDGRAGGLVLGGGGARGFAHIGVYRALVEAGVIIDRVGGTSAGAVVSGMIAAGFDADHMATDVWRMLGRWTPVTDPARPPVLSSCEGRKLFTTLHDSLGDIQIEDLWTDFYCVSTNLTRGRATVHRSGALWRWIRASMSIPGISPPLIVDGEVIVDGGLMDNVPTGVMRERDEGPMVACDVEPDSDLFLEPDLNLDLALAPTTARLDLLWRQVRPTGKRAPNLFDIVYRTVTLGNVEGTLRARREADLMIRPPVAEFHMLEFSSLYEIIEKGYADAAPRIAEWQRARAGAGPLDGRAPAPAAAVAEG
jgi:NTE family protein/lysophospholipid hydrolase